MKRFNNGFLFLSMLVCLCNVCSGEVAQKVEVGDSFVVEEYPIDNIICSFERLPQEILNKRKRWRESFAREKTYEEKIEEINRKLKPLGYKLIHEGTSSDSYSFYKGQNLIVKLLHKIHGFSIDRKNKTFIFFASRWIPYSDDGLVGDSESGFVCINGNIQKRQEDWVSLPIWINGQLLRIKLLGTIDHTEIYFIVNGFIDKPLLDEILRNTTTSWVGAEIRGRKFWHFKINLPELPPQVIYTFEVPIRAGGGPIIELQSYKESWVLEAEGRVIINGKDLCKEKNYGAIERFCLIKGKPFYFFAYQKDMNWAASWPGIGKVRMFYNDEVLPVWYDWVGVGRLNDGVGTEPCLINENMICFFAQRGKQWYYVEAGIYK